MAAFSYRFSLLSFLVCSSLLFFLLLSLLPSSFRRRSLLLFLPSSPLGILLLHPNPLFGITLLPLRLLQ